MIVSHYSRTFGMKLPVADGDTFYVVDAQHHEIATLEGHLVRQILEHHLAVVALDLAVGRAVTRPPATPYRKALAAVPFTSEQKLQRAALRRARAPKRKP